MLVLESEDEVQRRGVKPYCELAGWGQASDGYNVAISHPDGEGLRVAMENALRQTEVAADEVDYVNAHATSTEVGDNAEINGIRAVFGNPFDPVQLRERVTQLAAISGDYKWAGANAA